MRTVKDLFELLQRRVSHLDFGGRRVDGVLEEVWSNGMWTRVTVLYGPDRARRLDEHHYRENFIFEEAQDFRPFECGFEKVTS